MRSSLAGLLAVLGLGTIVVLVLLVFGNLGVRSELEAARAELGELRADLGSGERTVTADELRQQLDDLEASITDALLVDGAGAPQATSGDDVSDRLDEILERLEALENRIDEICGNVPVC